MKYSRIRPWMVVLVVSTLYLGAVLFANDADPKAFVTLGSCFSQCTGADGESCPADTEGYDGQFAYYIALKPVDSPDCLDVPAYRMQRILLPALGRVLSVGQATLIPWAFLGINLVALVGATALLEDLLIQERQSRWFALSYGMFIGVVMAVRLSTTEALAYGLVVAAIWFGAREQWGWSAVLLALAGLAKETTGLFVAGYGLYFVLHHRWWSAVRLALVVGVPFVLWQLVLYSWLGELGVGSGGAKGTPFEIIPYAGVWKIWSEGNFLAFLILGIVLAIPTAVLPSLWALRYTWRDLRSERWSVYVCLLGVNAAIMPFVPFSTYREYLGLFRFIPGLVLMIVLYSAHRRLRRPLVYSTLYIVLLLFAFQAG